MRTEKLISFTRATQSILCAAWIALVLLTSPAYGQDAPGHEGHNHGGTGESVALPISPPEFVAFLIAGILVLNTARKAMVHRPWSATAEEIAARPDIATAGRQLKGLLAGLAIGAVLLPVYLPLHERLHHGDEGDEPLGAHAGHDHEAEPHGHSPLVYTVSPIVLGAIGSLVMQLKSSSDPAS